MYLLLDECCGRSLVGPARALGHMVQRTIEVGTLGRQATDHEIFEFAVKAGAVLVTVNRSDFIKLAGRGREHSGVILIPSVPRAQLQPLFIAVLRVAEPLLLDTPNLFVEVDANGRISRFRLP